MSKYRVYFIFIALILIGSSAWAALDPSEIGVGARPLGMGKAYIGQADDASSIFLNPAGLEDVGQFDIVSMSGALFQDVNYVMIGLANRSPIGVVGVGYVNASVAQIPITVLTGTGSTASITQIDSTSYTNSLITFTFAREVRENFSAGANLKYFVQGFSGGGASMEGATGSGMDLDLGFKWDVNQWLNLGMIAVNLLPADSGGAFTWQKNNVKEGIPAVLKIGSAFKIIGENGLRKIKEQQLSLLLDSEMQLTLKRPGIWHVGLEYRPIKILALRTGIDQKPKATNDGIGVDNNLTFGVGLLFKGFNFDYAYHQFGELSENATHFFSIGYGGPKEKKKVVKTKEKVEAGLPEPVVIPKPKLMVFSDVPDNYWAREAIEYLATLKIMNGYPDGSFLPAKGVTRAEICAILVKAKDLPITFGGAKFSDVSKDYWADSFIRTAVKRGYMKGYSDNTFKPGELLTRAQAVVVLAKFGGLPVKKKLVENPYSDVSKKFWAAPSISAAKRAGYLSFLNGKNFGPDKPVTRAEVAEIISKTKLGRQKIRELQEKGIK